MTPIPRNFESTDTAWVLALNELHAVELSALSEAQLITLIQGAIHTRVIDERAGFMIALDQAGDNDSPNFKWFKDRLDHFVYVDRIVISASHRGLGLARCLYEDLFHHAARRGYDRVVCEVNSDPPNPGSDAFHQALGFTVMGSATLEDRGKSVRYMALDLTDRQRP